MLAANLADVTVRMQHSVDQYVGRALKETAEIEDAAAIQRLRDDQRR